MIDRYLSFIIKLSTRLLKIQAIEKVSNFNQIIQNTEESMIVKDKKKMRNRQSKRLEQVTVSIHWAINNEIRSDIIEVEE